MASSQAGLRSRWVLPATDRLPVLLPHLDYGLIRSNPKLFQSYSDVTVLHWALPKCAGMVTFHGPALLPQLGEHPRVLADTDRWLQAAWFGDAPLRFRPATVWTDEFLDWDQQQDRTYGYDQERRGGCGSWPPAGRRLRVCRSSAMSSAATPIPCSPCRSVSAPGSTRPPRPSRHSSQR